jgi:phospholipase C
MQGRGSVRRHLWIALLLAAALASLMFASVPSVQSASAALTGIHKIQHVVMIMQENHSFDNYFGTFSGADGIAMSNGVPTACLPSVAGGCKRPYVDHRDVVIGGPHSAANMASDIDGEKMDGFLTESEKASQSCSDSNAGCPDNPVNVLGYHTQSDIPNYWSYARNYVLQDRMFEPNASWSLPAHLFQVSGWSASCPSHDPMKCVSDLDLAGARPDNFADPTNVKLNPLSPVYAWTDLTYLMHRQNVSWGYYVVSGNEPDCADAGALTCAPVAQQPYTPGIWNPLPYFDTVRNDGQVGNVQSVSKFYTAAKAGTLPAVSWIQPSGDLSDHPPLGSTSAGQSFVTSVINAVGNSPDWNSTAIFVAWDDWGGFYDHVAPPKVDQNGYGLRVPGFLVSPYAKQGYVDHQTLSFDAYLRFIEDDFLGGQRLDPANDGRPDSRPTVRESVPILGNLASEFDFTQAPRPPMLLPVHPTTTLTNVPPYPPRAITVAGGNGQATAGWTGPISAGGSPVTSYHIVPYHGSTVLSAWAFPASATSGTVTGLTNGQTYTFKVFATNAVGNGMLSVSTAPVAIGTPTAPSPTSATPGNGNATVGWAAPSSTNGSPITGYRVTPYLGLSPLSPVDFAASARSGVVGALSNGHTYSFTVAALNGNGVGAPAGRPTATVGAPTAPKVVSAVPGPGNTSVTLQWTPPTNDNGSAITGYVVTTRYQFKPVSTRTFPASATTVTVTGLMTAKPYTFVVAATNARGTGAQSLSTTEIVVGSPTAPTGVTATRGVGAATVHWTAPASDNGSPVTGYNVTPYLAGVAQTPRTFNSTATTEPVTGLTAGKTYWFKVAAKNARGTGPVSPASNAVTPT